MMHRLHLLVYILLLFIIHLQGFYVDHCLYDVIMNEY